MTTRKHWKYLINMYLTIFHDTLSYLILQNILQILIVILEANVLSLNNAVFKSILCFCYAWKDESNDILTMKTKTSSLFCNYLLLMLAHLR